MLVATSAHPSLCIELCAQGAGKWPERGVSNFVERHHRPCFGPRQVTAPVHATIKIRGGPGGGETKFRAIPKINGVRPKPSGGGAEMGHSNMILVS